MTFTKYPLLALFGACFGLIAVCANAAEPTAKDAALAKPTKTAFAPQDKLSGAGSSATRATDADTLIFTSAPRESAVDGAKIYGPVADYLGKVLGKKVVYRHPGTWGAYRSEMLRGDYDIIFDGPHFNSYRVEKLNHNVLVRLPGLHGFTVVTRKTEKYTALTQMGGRSFCTHAPPNLGTLVLISQFDNPSRQPYLITMDGWENIYKAVMSGRCVGAVLPGGQLKKLDKDDSLRVVYKTPTMPPNAISAGPRLTLDEQAKISAALLAPEADRPLEALRASWKITEKLVATNNQEFVGIADYLKSEYGYY
jgi:ABC-type phosphate/phosphonate transport system substrate-binding protein